MLSVFTRLATIAKTIEEGVMAQTGVEEAFMTHPIFGILTCCPSNIGPFRAVQNGGEWRRAA